MPSAIYSILGALGMTHPLHPVLVHFTIGSVVASFVFGLIAWIFRKPALFATARHASVFGLVSAFFTVFMGFMDWLYRFGGSLEDPTGRIILTKIILSGVLFLILFGAVIVNARVPKDSKVPLIFYTAAAVDVMAIGLFGGYLVWG